MTSMAASTLATASVGKLPRAVRFPVNELVRARRQALARTDDRAPNFGAKSAYINCDCCWRSAQIFDGRVLTLACVKLATSGLAVELQDRLAYLAEDVSALVLAYSTACSEFESGMERISRQEMRSGPRQVLADDFCIGTAVAIANWLIDARGTTNIEVFAERWHKNDGESALRPTLLGTVHVPGVR